jgi:hypothetical protein
VRAFTGVPVLVTIPRLTTARDVRLRRRRFWAAAASVALAVGVVVQALHHVARDNEALVALLARSSS